MKKVAIVHYMPLEFYPPVMNFLNYLSTFPEFKIHVYTTHNNKSRNIFQNKFINRIKRLSFPNLDDNAFIRLGKYLFFNIITFLKLVIQRPHKIVYYESFSAGPVYWYLKFFGTDCKLLIIYHEYFPPSWYLNGMRLVKEYHNYEKKYLYKRAEWISQTNEDRIELFLNDHPSINRGKMQILPNYPPKEWLNFESKSFEFDDVVKTVYVGTVSLEYTYIKEYCCWVIEQAGKVTFDIYSYNLNQESKDYLHSINSDHIRFYDRGIDYFDLPKVLNEYNVGVILYKGLTKNYIYNAPNKLFEYLACDLDVWFPKPMMGIIPYITKNTYPKVIMLDFTHLINFDLKAAVDKKNLRYSRSGYNAENALKFLVENLKN